METISITVNSVSLDFDYYRKISWAVAKSYNPDTSLTGWFDREQDRYSPSRKEGDAAGLPDGEE